MALRAEYLKELAAKLPLRNAGSHDRLRKLIIGGFFDTPKTTDQLTTEIRQTIGMRMQSNVVQTYMRKFMDQGIIRVLRSERYHGNYWVLASDEEVKEAQLAIQLRNGDRNQPFSVSKEKSAEVLSLPTHHLLASTKIKILFLAAN